MVSVGWGNGLFPSDRGGSGERCKDKITAAQIDEIVAAHHESRRLRIDDDDDRGMRYYRIAASAPLHPPSRRTVVCPSANGFVVSIANNVARVGLVSAGAGQDL